MKIFIKNRSYTTVQMIIKQNVKLLLKLVNLRIESFRKTSSPNALCDLTPLKQFIAFYIPRRLGKCVRPKNVYLH